MMSVVGVRRVQWEKTGQDKDLLLIAGPKDSLSDDVSIEEETELNLPLESDRLSRSSEKRVTQQLPVKTKTFVYVIVFFSMISGFLFGYDTGVIAGALLELDKDFSLDTTRKELVVSVTLVAAALGSIGGGPLNEKVGRKRTLMIASLVLTVSAIAMAAPPLTSWGWTIVLGGRFIVGIGIGLVSMTVPMYLAECAPTHLRGRLIVAYIMVVNGGLFAAAISGYGFSYIAQGWRYMFGLAAIPSVVCFIAFFFLPESPRWLVGRGRSEAARAVLRRVRGGDGEQVEEELQQIQENLEHSAEENRQGVLRKLWTILTTRHLLLALIIGCGLQAIQQLSGINTVMYYSPTILRMSGVVNDHTATGLGAVIAFGNFVFTIIGLYLVERSGRRKLILSSLAGVVISLIVLGVAFYLANATSPRAYSPAHLNTSADLCHAHSTTCSKWRNCDDCVISDSCHYCAFNGSFGDKDTIGLCVSSGDSHLYHHGECLMPDSHELAYTRDPDSSESCLSAVLHNTTVKTYEYCPSDYVWLTMAALVMYIVSFSPGMGPIPWTVNAEIYPNWARSLGNSIATTTMWVSNVLVSVTFLHVTQYLTRYGAFWLYAGLSAAGWLFIFLFLPETKGKRLEHIEQLFKRPLCPPPGIGRSGQCRLRQRKHSMELCEPPITDL